MSVNWRMTDWALRRPDSIWVGVAVAAVLGAAIVEAVMAVRLLGLLAADGAFLVPRWSWLRVTPAWGWITGILWSIGVGLFAIRRLRPLGGALIALAACVTLALDLQLTGDHLYLLAIAALAFAAHTWLESRSGLRRVASVPLRVYQIQVSIVLLWTAVSKVNPLFVSGGMLNVAMADGIIPFPDALRTPAVLAPLAGLVIVVEVFIGLGLWLERTRGLALMLAIGLHGAIILLMAIPLTLVAFALVMGAGYALYAAEPWAKESGEDAPVEPAGRSDKSKR